MKIWGANELSVITLNIFCKNKGAPKTLWEDQ